MDTKKGIHQQLIIDISENMDQTKDSQEFEHFDAALASLLPKGILARNKTIIKKLQALTTRGQLQPGKYEELKKICIAAKNLEILGIIEDAEKEIAGMSAGEPGDQGIVYKREQVPSKSVTETENRPIQCSPDGEPSTSKDRKRRASDDGSPDQSDPLFKKRHGKGYYDTDGKKGYLLILNSKTNREGTDDDVNRLKAFFGKVLKFDIDDPRSYMSSDLTTDQFEECLKAARTSLNNELSKKYYCFICVIMSHGNEHGVATKDGLYDTSKIRTFFNNSNMPNFAGRPKLFFLQACRGGKQMGYVDAADETEADQEMEIDESDIIHEIPIDADTLLAYATTPGYISYAETNIIRGTYFLRDVCEVFSADYTTDHVEEMMITVREKTAETNIPVLVNKTDVQKVKQMPCTWSTLTKRLLFTPLQYGSP